MSMDETKEEKLERLEKALLDQKLRAERHRSNFEALKAEHLILQEVNFTAVSYFSSCCTQPALVYQSSFFCILVLSEQEVGI